jgi:hypothetical protein
VPAALLARSALSGRENRGEPGTGATVFRLRPTPSDVPGLFPQAEAPVRLHPTQADALNPHGMQEAWGSNPRSSTQVKEIIRILTRLGWVIW